MSIHEIEEIKRSVGDVREWLKDQRFTDEDREPDSNINISIDQLNRALALMMIVEKDIERLRELSGDAGKLRKERDEARRLYINEMCLQDYGDLNSRISEAKERGWECFEGFNK